MGTKIQPETIEVSPSDVRFGIELVPPGVTARLIGTTAGTLAIWRSQKRYPLPYVKIGAKVFYRVDDIKKFIELRTMSGVSEPLTPRYGQGRSGGNRRRLRLETQ